MRTVSDIRKVCGQEGLKTRMKHQNGVHGLCAHTACNIRTVCDQEGL